MRKIKIILPLLLALSLTLNCSIAFASETESTQELGKKLVRELFRDIKVADMEVMQQKIAKGFQSGHSDGARSRAEELKLVATLNLGDYILSDFQVTRNGPVMVVTYYISVEETIKGKRLSSRPAPRISVFLKTPQGWKWMAHANLKPLKENPANDLKSFVENAAKLIEKEGKAAFSKLRKKETKWFYGNHYVMVYDLQGIRYVYPPDPSKEGKSAIDVKDVNGKPIGKMLIEAATGKDKSGWVHYQWLSPGEILPRWKSTYIVEVEASSGKKYLVGSGEYGMEVQREFIVDVVDAAAQLIKNKGRAAFSTLRDKSSQFIFEDVYVFVDKPDGTELVNPAFPKIEGRNIYNLKDARGKYLVREYIKLAEEKGSGWIIYMWPKPGEPKPSCKSTYVKKVTVNGQTYIVGAGLYLE